MARHWSWVIALLVSGCAVQTAGSPEEASTQAGATPDTSLMLDRARAPQGPEDLCAEGQDEIHGGVLVHVPVPCVRDDIDRGDPPPDARAGVNPGSLIERVTQEELVGLEAR